MLIDDNYGRNDLLVEGYNETLEGDQLIVEALMEEVGLENFSEEEVYGLMECGILNERSVVRLDRKAHKNRAKKKTAIILAKENNDMLYKRLAKVYAQKKMLINLIMKKYGTRANARVNKIKFTNKGMVKPQNTASANAMKKIAKSVQTNSTQLKTKDMR